MHFDCLADASAYNKARAASDKFAFSAIFTGSERVSD
jgi:hypothetical protein